MTRMGKEEKDMYCKNERLNIGRFIKTVGAVSEPQIYGMFRNLDDKQIRMHLKGLLRDREVVLNENGLYVRRNAYGVSDFAQKKITRAAWVLSYIGEPQIAEFYVTQYPFQLFFCTMDGTAFDVAVVNCEGAYDTLAALRRTTEISSDGSDAIKHIGMSFGIKDASGIIRESGFFDYLAEIVNNRYVLTPLTKKASSKL